ncbi:MAG: peptidase M20 [Acidobacteria bacterium]|jgi:acetylornithine deacetylase/succinyl-diaminopimelate desuccinylase-like protein|nr:peptidase M20 [Acidobacteriota bacterium]MDP7339294.1 M20/M25/M40 family metallo-hydrolase [Vicinamibacterales bacterium]MDP7479274.1 M20/M25/M40 family metallo-hydrolase [Vicinamibacterales bacterium]MDP7691334.1 M20/M25/M40 family metallo-hydrolase [Vicinamibacterales bacterium]HJN47010.1 M20/M25/M40 family metallo-hydrolase [Vicinamibacterales bacterium]
MKSPTIALGIVLAVCASVAPLSQQASPGPIDPDDELRGIVAHPEVRRALALAHELEARAEQELIELTEIPAPPFEEAARAARYAELLGGTGLDNVAVDEVGNVLARRPGTGAGETVAIVAHLDTVFSPGTDVTVRRQADRLYAPGIGDNTRGLVLLLNVARAIVRAEVRTVADILFVGSVGEEGLGDLRGVAHLLSSSGSRIDQFIAIDGGSDSQVVNEAVGSRRYRVTVTGPGGHSWGDFGLANPAHGLARAMYYFDEAAAELVNAGPASSYNVGRIGGGTSVNAVPHESWAEVDMRSVDTDQLQRMDDVLRNAVARGLDEQNRRRDRGEALSADIELIGDRPSGIVVPDTPLVQRALAVTRFLGMTPRLGAASTDANLPIAHDIPAVTIGRGGVGGGAHSLDEWWSPRNAHVAVQRALLLLVASAGLAG